ncbi:MAG: VPLPA-CTERM sorting domain-containing protein [Pseudomonadota bacterium]
MIRKLIAVVFLLLPGTAFSATIPFIGGNTTVEITADLNGLGLAGAPFLFASVDTSGPNPVFSFPITGGSTNGNTLIEHDGSGVTLAALSDPTINATVSNFLIDVGAGTVSGNVNGSTDQAVLFDFGTVDGSGIQLLIADPLAGALTSVFGAPDLAGAEFGIANAFPETANVPAVPLPAGLPLLAVGLGGFWFVRRNQRTDH